MVMSFGALTMTMRNSKLFVPGPWSRVLKWPLPYDTWCYMTIVAVIRHTNFFATKVRCLKISRIFSAKDSLVFGTIRPWIGPLWLLQLIGLMVRNSNLLGLGFKVQEPELYILHYFRCGVNGLGSGIGRLKFSPKMSNLQLILSRLQKHSLS